MSFLSKLFSRKPGANLEELWRGRPAIYPFIRTQADPLTGRLKDSMCPLPDEEMREQQNFKFMCGAEDGIWNHHSGPDPGFDGPSEIHQLLNVYGISKSGADLVALYRRTVELPTLSYIDRLQKLIFETRSPSPDILNEIGSLFLLNAPDREPVKLGLALVCMLDDAKLVEYAMNLGCHEEYTLFAATGLANWKDSEKTLWKLAQTVNGWGRVHTVERLAMVAASPAVKDWLLREGFSNSVMDEYLAYSCATAGDLVGALGRSDIDAELIESSGRLIEALIRGGPSKDIYDFSGAFVLLSRYLQVANSAPSSLAVLSAVVEIKHWAAADAARPAGKVKSLTESEVESIASQADIFLMRNELGGLVESGLRSNDDKTFWIARSVAKRMQVDARAVYWERLRRDPARSGNWYDVASAADRADMIAAIDLFEKTHDLDRIASGPADELGLGKGYESHQCLGFILQELYKFPGAGRNLIRAALKSPVTRDRNLAVKALSAWDAPLDQEIHGELEDAAKAEPNPKTRETMLELIKAIQPKTEDSSQT